MITSVFKKSTIVNYSLIGALLVVFFFLHQTTDATMVTSPKGFTKTTMLLLLILTSFFLINFTVKKNKKNTPKMKQAGNKNPYRGIENLFFRSFYFKKE